MRNSARAVPSFILIRSMIVRTARRRDGKSQRRNGGRIDRRYRTVSRAVPSDQSSGCGLFVLTLLTPERFSWKTNDRYATCFNCSSVAKCQLFRGHLRVLARSANERSLTDGRIPTVSTSLVTRLSIRSLKNDRPKRDLLDS